MSKNIEALNTFSMDCINPSFCNSTPMLQIVPKLNLTRYQPYTEYAVETSFYNLQKHIKEGNIGAYRVIGKNGKYEYERLGFANKISYKYKELAEKTFIPSLHFFNLEDSLNRGENTSIDLHNHLRPLGVFPMHPDGRIGEVAYKMLTEKHCPEGGSIVRIHDYVRYGYPYGLDNPLLDFHSVSTSGPIISFIMARDKQGPVNSREPGAIFEERPKRKKALIELALHANKATMESIDRRDEEIVAEDARKRGCKN